MQVQSVLFCYKLPCQVATLNDDTQHRGRNIITTTMQKGVLFFPVPTSYIYSFGILFYLPFRLIGIDRHH